MATNGSNGATTSIFIRGANSNQVLVLIDGMRVGSATIRHRGLVAHFP